MVISASRATPGEWCLGPSFSVKQLGVHCLSFSFLKLLTLELLKHTLKQRGQSMTYTQFHADSDMA